MGYGSELFDVYRPPANLGLYTPLLMHGYFDIVPEYLILKVGPVSYRDLEIEYIEDMLIFCIRNSITINETFYLFK